MRLLETGIPNLDRILGGGLPERDQLLMVSPAGAGKTALGLQMVFHAAAHGKPALYVSTVSEPPNKLPLLNNTAEYTEEGGHIWLTVQREGSEAIIKVRDTGKGIPAESLPHIFDFFTQLNHSPARSSGGLGLGLTLVRHLVEMHGGRVQAHSASPGQGSEFVVYLPRLTQAQVQRPAQRRDGRDKAESPSRRILLVDGEVVEMAPIGSEHAGKVSRFVHLSLFCRYQVLRPK